MKIVAIIKMTMISIFTVIVSLIHSHITYGKDQVYAEVAVMQLNDDAAYQVMQSQSIVGDVIDVGYFLLMVVFVAAFIYVAYNAFIKQHLIK